MGAGGARAEGEHEGILDVGMPARGRKTSLRRAVGNPGKDTPHREAKMPGEIVGLIEAASERAPWMQRHGNDGVSARQA